MVSHLFHKEGGAVGRMIDSPGCVLQDDPQSEFLCMPRQRGSTFGVSGRLSQIDCIPLWNPHGVQNMFMCFRRSKCESFLGAFTLSRNVCAHGDTP